MSHANIVTLDNKRSSYAKWKHQQVRPR